MHTQEPVVEDDEEDDEDDDEDDDNDEVDVEGKKYMTGRVPIFTRLDIHLVLTLEFCLFLIVCAH